MSANPYAPLHKISGVSDAAAAPGDAVTALRVQCHRRTSVDLLRWAWLIEVTRQASWCAFDISKENKIHNHLIASLTCTTFPKFPLLQFVSVVFTFCICVGQCCFVLPFTRVPVQQHVNYLVSECLYSDSCACRSRTGTGRKRNSSTFFPVLEGTFLRKCVAGTGRTEAGGIENWVGQHSKTFATKNPLLELKDNRPVVLNPQIGTVQDGPGRNVFKEWSVPVFCSARTVSLDLRVAWHANCAQLNMVLQQSIWQCVRVPHIS